MKNAFFKIRCNLAFILSSAYLASIFMPLFFANDKIVIVLRIFVGFVCYIWLLINNDINSIIRWTVVSLLFSLFMILSMSYNNNSQIYHVFYIWGAVGGGLAIYYHRPQEKVWRFFCVMTMLLVLGFILGGHYGHETVFYSRRNSINAIAIFGAVYGYILMAREKKEELELSYSYAVSAFVISVWSGGRSGIVITGLMIVFVFLYNLLFMKKINKVPVILSVGILMVASVLFGNYFLHAEDRFISAGVESLRYNLWAEYYDSLSHNYLNVFYGANTASSNYLYMHMYNGNLHNAFLMLHSKYGLLGFVIVVYGVIKCFKCYYSKRLWVLLFCLSCITARVMSDWIAFPGYFDSLFIVIIESVYCISVCDKPELVSSKNFEDLR